MELRREEGIEKGAERKIGCLSLAGKSPVSAGRAAPVGLLAEIKASAKSTGSLLLSSQLLQLVLKLSDQIRHRLFRVTVEHTGIVAEEEGVDQA